MHVLLVHNEYGKVSGEEIVVRSIHTLLDEHGHKVTPFFRSSAELEGQPLGKAKAFFTGIYNPSSRRVIRALLRECRPDLVHIHNLFPLISPSILAECRRAGLPVVMTVHNYRLVCPNGLHMVNGRTCERCAGGREYHCLLNRCEGSLFKSAAYAARNAFARKTRVFHDNVTMYAALTEFQRDRLIAAGFAPDRIAVIPNMVGRPPANPAESVGDWVGFIGRISHEKGIPTLLAAAAALPDIPFKIAGACDRMPSLPASAPANVEFVGHLAGAPLDPFFRRTRILVLCSTCYEGFPTVLADAMLHAKPVVCSRIGGLPEIVDDGRTGLLFDPASHADLAAALRRLWDTPELCRTMGAAGRAKAEAQFSRSSYYHRLMNLYRRALELGPGGPESRTRQRGQKVAAEQDWV